MLEHYATEYGRGKLSLARAAREAGVSLWEMQSYVREQEIPAQYDGEDFEDRDTMFVIDCNPSFAIYTQLALVAADFVVVPFTADDSSRRAVENVAALLYGIGDAHTAAYARISFSKRAKEDGVDIPRLHTFVSNRQTLYEGKPSKAVESVSGVIKNTVDEIYLKHRAIFANPRQKPSEGFLEVPDYHTHLSLLR